MRANEREKNDNMRETLRKSAKNELRKAFVCSMIESSESESFLLYDKEKESEPKIEGKMKHNQKSYTTTQLQIKFSTLQTHPLRA